MKGSNLDPVNSDRRALLSTAAAIGATTITGSAAVEDAPHSIAVYATMNALRANPSIMTTVAATRWIAGAMTPRDGGGGLFVLDLSDATSPDDGATIIVDKAGNRWRRQMEDSRVNVKWFGAVGDGVADDTRALQSAVDYVGDREDSVMFLPRGVYRITDCLRVARKYFRCLANDATIVNGMEKHEFISGPTTPDLRIPTASDPGSLKGCGFYFTTLIYYSSFERLTLFGFRFAMAWLVPHNSPIFRECGFEKCNVAIFCYQGSQNYQIVNCNAENCNVVWVSSATCFPEGTEHAGQDNYYTDGLRIANEGGYGSFGPLTINEFFDDWFVRSILRPETESLSVAAKSTYNDYLNRPYTNNHDHCQPSGRLLFIPFRNLRSCFGLSLRNIDMRSGARRGIGLVNTSVFDFVFENPAVEGMWDADTRTQDGPALEIGAALSGNVTGVSPLFWSINTSNTHPVIGWTQRGGYIGAGSRRLALLGADLAPAPGHQYFGLNRGEIHRQNENVFVLENNPVGRDLSDARPGAAILHYFDFQSGTKYTDHKVEVIEDGIPFIGYIPVFDGRGWRFDINFMLTNPIAGSLEVSVLNLCEGAWDYGTFYVEASREALETFILQAPLENGSPVVAIDAKPSMTARFTRFHLETGSEIVLDYFDEAKNVIHPIGGAVTGLKSAVRAGTKLTRGNICDVLKPFHRGWVDVGFGITGYTGTSTFGIKNNVAARDGAHAGALFLIVKFKSNPKMPERLIASAPPTTGMWARNAVVWNNSCAAGGTIGWVCVEAGSPGQWKSFGQIAN